MKLEPTTPLLAILVLIPGLIGLASCATSSPPDSPEGPRTPLKADSQSENRRDTNGRAVASTALIINGDPISWATLRPLLAEAAGGEVTDELALEHALRQELRARGVTVGEAQLDAARETWLALLEESGVSAQAESEIRRRRGLGTERFRRLLWRNAALRALVDPSEIAVSETEIGLTRSIRTGKRYLTTGVVSRDTESALAIAAQCRSAGAGSAAALWSAALDRDLRPFRSVISPLDPSFPESIRRALPSLGLHNPGPAIAVENGYAVVVVDGVLEPSANEGPSDAELRRELTIRKTRVAMQRLASKLVARTSVTKLDRSIP